MLQHNITNFLEYCNNSDFSKRSIETLSFRLNEFNKFIQERSISEIKTINYQHLLLFVADYGTPSPSIKKARPPVGGDIAPVLPLSETKATD